MSDAIVIDTARLGDVPAIHRIESSAFPAPWRLEFFEAEVAASHRFNIVARRDGVIVGYLFAMWLFDEMHINKIAVIESERRKGVADTLMASCFAFAREHDVHAISLEVRTSNHGAQEFYRYLNFKSSYVRQRYYPDGESAVVMTRMVQPSS